MSSQALRIKADVHMQPATNLPVVKPLMAGWGPDILFRGKFYPGRILQCDTPIQPGAVGEAIIGMLAHQIHDIGLEVGSTLELMAGPHLIATATVASLQDEPDTNTR